MNSMTGFGRATTRIRSFAARVEISGVNRKQTEIAFGLPKGCTEWEQAIRPLILESVSRGRVFVSISLEPAGDGDSGHITLDEPLMRAYMQVLERASELAGSPLHPVATDLTRLDIIHHATAAELEHSETWPMLEPALREALEHFLAMRATEGANLRQDMLERLHNLQQIKQQIAALAPEVPVRLRENMVARLQEAGLPVDLDDERIIREIALFSDKCDVSEELGRLDSHFSQFTSLCDGDAPAGRPLDFLCQEIFREFNTIGSKANDAALAHLVVSAKTELEKIREQVQNIE